MALVPSSLAMIELLKMSATRPIPRCDMSDLPLDETMPADSWPRCCCAYNPRYARFAASGCRYTPNTPHSSWKTSRFDSSTASTARTESSSVTASKPPGNRVFVNPPQFRNVFVDRRANLEPGSDGHLSDNRKLQSASGEQFPGTGCIARRNRQNHRRCAFAKKIIRVSASSSPKFYFGSQNRARIETGLDQCHCKPALGDI